MKAKLYGDRMELINGMVKTTLIGNKIVEEQMADAALFNAKLARETTSCIGPGAGRHIGDMPLPVYNDIMRQAQGDKEKETELIRRWFMNPDNALFRAWGKW